jgi:hypothetical protein
MYGYARARQHDLLRWAIDRSGRPEEKIVVRFPDLPAWEAGDREPTLRQLHDFATATRTPFGYLLLDEPPEGGPCHRASAHGRGSGADRPSANQLAG